jgi:hypothetical protein
MDWVSTLTGFREGSYDDARAQLRVEGAELVSAVNDKRYGVGSLSVSTLSELRSRVVVSDCGRTLVRSVVGESPRRGRPVRELWTMRSATGSVAISRSVRIETSS